MQANFHPGGPHKKSIDRASLLLSSSHHTFWIIKYPRTFQRIVMLRILVLSKWFTRYLIFNAL